MNELHVTTTLQLRCALRSVLGTPDAVTITWQRKSGSTRFSFPDVSKPAVELSRGNKRLAVTPEGRIESRDKRIGEYLRNLNRLTKDAQ